MEHHEHRVQVTNPHEKKVLFTLEPWGEVCQMEPGEPLEVVGKGPAEGSLYIEFLESGITVYGWPGSTVSVLRKGQPIPECSGGIPVPPAPSGQSIKQFVGWMKGKTGKK